MAGHKQFCAIAKALDVIGERWTPLVLRELICGSERFSQIHRGVPRMSPTLLSKRLSALEAAGVVTKGADGAYRLTEAGRELQPVIEALGVWGQRWTRTQLSEDHLDPDLLMWDMQRRVAHEALPDRQVCIQFRYPELGPGKADYWLIASREAAEICILDPGFEVDLFVTCDLATMTRVWIGDVSLETAMKEGAIDLHGPEALRRAFPGWLLLSVFAEVPVAEDPLAGEPAVGTARGGGAVARAR